MEEIERLYFSIPEAAKMMDVRESKLRYWDYEYGVVAVRGGRSNNRKITTENMRVFTKIKLLSCIMNSEGIKNVLKGRIKITIDNDLIEEYG